MADLDTVTVRPLAIIDSCAGYDGLHAALRARAEELNIARRTIDESSGLCDGYAAKLLAPVPMKHLGLRTVGPLLGALGLRLVVIEDPETTARRERFPRRVRVNSRTAQPSRTADESLRNHLAELGRRGSAALNNSLSPHERSKSARRAAQARWRKAKGKRK